jgi:undecaprenyl pyrophosphate phosphatase UppP
MLDFRERTKSQFAVVYLTLISVIQACVLGYLFTQTDSVLPSLTLRTGLLILNSFLYIALTWADRHGQLGSSRSSRSPTSFAPSSSGGS